MNACTMLTLEKLFMEPYATLICYPRATKSEIKRRVRELQELGVKALEFVGEKRVFNVSVLGKGCVGIVTVACRNHDRVALKIRRVDADRSTMQKEAKLLKKANSLHVGPKLLGASRNFLLMQLVDGLWLAEWVKKHKKPQIRNVLREVLEQCWRLDGIGLDHGELSHAPKHVMVNEESEPFIVDFETASQNRRPSNVTSICQFLFIGSETARSVAEKFGGTEKKAIIEKLRHYKEDRKREDFDRILAVCGL